MVKRSALIIILSFLTLSLFAADKVSFSGGGTFGGSYDYNWKDEKGTQVYLANPYLGVSYSSSALKAEFKASYKVDNYYPNSFSLDKAYFRFRVPSFNSKKITFTVGKAPISWGMGYYYRVGDVLLDDENTYQVAGSAVDRTIYLASATIPLGLGFSLEGAFGFPFENNNTKKVGALLTKNFDNDYLKQLKVAYAFKSGKKHKASIVADFALGADISLGLESQFRSVKDYRVVFNLMKQFSIESELSSHLLTLYVSAETSFEDKSYNALASLSYDLTERWTLSASSNVSFDNSGYKESTFPFSFSFLIQDGVKAEGGLALTHKDDAINTSVSLALDIGF